jgi:hypothetical protein
MFGLDRFPDLFGFPTTSRRRDGCALGFRCSSGTIEICWSPLQSLMKRVHEEAREKRNSSGAA